MLELKDQVCSLEPSKRLKELGVKQDSYFYYGRDSISESIEIGHYAQHWSSNISAYTVAELGEMLPPFIEDESYRLIYYKFKKNYACDYIHVDEGDCYAFIDAESVKEADARAKMLIHLIENNLVTEEWKKKWLVNNG